MDIIFNCEDKLTSDMYPPTPTINLLPEWYKDLPENNSNLLNSQNPLNVKSCLPVVDYITSGYLIINSYEISLEEKTINFQNFLNVQTMRSNENSKNILLYKNFQCPLQENGIKKTYFKVRLDWNIKTPMGYSCLIIQPFYHKENKYTLLPSIIDTDVYDGEIFVAGYLNSKEIISIMPGDPIVQVIPFKRDSWTMKIENKVLHSKIKHFLEKGYKKMFHTLKVYQ
jgi:dUTPase